MIFDFDDSIWLQNISEANKNLAFLKDASKTSKIIKAAKLVFAGNEFLANYARQYNKNVVIVPTTIDTEVYKRQEIIKDNRICIGWSGSFSTIEHFLTAVPSLKRIKEKYRDTVKFMVIGDANFYNEELDIKGLPWKASTEIENLSHFDIG